ncbi:TPM domain-containing protein [Patescibacteria group bacterium]|nr:TPM domain-containing protein [Patescibacteria group bacterium]
MKRKKLVFIVLFIVLVVTGCQQSTDPAGYKDIPARPNPPTAISDFANVIDDDLQSKYETKLMQLEKNTSIAVVVVTVETIGDNYGSIEDYARALFNTWGIGHKGSNSGILLIFAMQEHKVRIETGYGMEEFLTDASSGQIINHNIVPYFKAGDKRKGFDEGISTLISFIHTQVPSSDQRVLIQKQHEKEKQDQKEAQSHVINIVIVTALVMVALVLIFFGYRGIVRRKKFNDAKKAAYLAAENLSKKISSINPAMIAAKEQHDKYPAWAKKEADRYRKEIRKLMEEMEVDLKEAKDKIEEDPAAAIGIMDLLYENYQKAEVSYHKSVNALPQKIKFYEESAPHKQSETFIALIALKERIIDLQDKQHYTIFKDDEEVYHLLQKEYELLGETKDPKALFDASSMLLEKINKQMRSIENELQTVIRNTERIAEVKKQTTETISGIFTTAKNSLAYLMQYAVKEVWNELQGNITRAEQGLSTLEAKIKEAEEYNTMTTQRFVESESILNSIQEQITRNVALLMLVATQHEAWTQAVEALPALLNEANQYVDKALKKIKDSDVENAAKQKAKQAASDLQNAQTLSNLILQAALLAKVITQAKEALKKAESDISDAENARARARKKRNSSVYSSSYSSSYSGGGFSSGNSGGGSGFGGFGGGMSGGGGATGSW